MPPQNPLTEQDREEIDRALQAAEDAQALIEQAARAGMDVAEFQSRTREARDRLLRIKSTFFPGT